MTSLNERAFQLCEAMVADAAELRIEVRTLTCGTRVIDCGVEAAGNIEAGRRLAEVCLAGLGSVYITQSEAGSPTPYEVYVTTKDAVVACMASQFAGWEIKGEKFFAMGSGPMRAAACREELFNTIGHCERPNACVGVLETSKLPPESVCVDIAAKCGVAPDRLTLLAARTASAAGTVQIVARSVETALHKLHELGFDLQRIVSGSGTAPLPPVAKDDMTAIGWTNDAIMYGGSVTLGVRGGLDDLHEIGRRVPSCASPDYGRPFAEIFARYDHDFYRIDPLLFSPAMVAFVDSAGGGQGLVFDCRAPHVLSESFGEAGS
jgi:methenyltetrahydromethanopterin cyclohydrolase